MDRSITTLAEYVLSARNAVLSDAALGAGIRHHLDGVGCAAGGFASDPCRIARQIAATVSPREGCSVYGLPDKSTPEYATFANASANRHLDYNDAGVAPARGGGHPNDMTPAIFAAVEMVGGSGLDLIRGTHIAYETFAGVGGVDWRKLGWDQGALVAMATAATTAGIFGLDLDGIGNAIALAITSGVPLRVTRTGELSHWKGCATAHGAMNGVFCARLAQAGMTGPAEAFEGVDGLWSRVTGAFAIERLGQPISGMSALERTFFKFFPSEYNSQGPLASILKLRPQFNLSEVKEINISTYWMSWHEIGGGQGDRAQKWDPKTRESADHSLPYMVAVALVDGMVSLRSFEPERVNDPALRPLMNKINVIHDPAFDERMKTKGEWAALVEIVLEDGRVLTDEVSHPKGSTKNPMDDNELNLKFDSMIGYVLGPDEAKRCRDLLWSVDRLDTLEPLSRLFRSWSSRAQ